MWRVCNKPKFSAVVQKINIWILNQCFLTTSHREVVRDAYGNWSGSALIILITSMTGSNGSEYLLYSLYLCGQIIHFLQVGKWDSSDLSFKITTIFTSKSNFLSDTTLVNNMKFIDNSSTTTLSTSHYKSMIWVQN